MLNVLSELFLYIHELLSLKIIIVTVNVALNKTAYQQNPLKQNYSTGDASNAVDGQKSDLTRNGGQCVVSAGRETATWWVNLTSIHSIQKIKIYYMTDNKPWGIAYFNNDCFDVAVFHVLITYNVSSYTSLKVSISL